MHPLLFHLSIGNTKNKLLYTAHVSILSAFFLKNLQILPKPDFNQAGFLFDLIGRTCKNPPLLEHLWKHDSECLLHLWQLSTITDFPASPILVIGFLFYCGRNWYSDTDKKGKENVKQTIDLLCLKARVYCYHCLCFFKEKANNYKYDETASIFFSFFWVKLCILKEENSFIFVLCE